MLTASVTPVTLAHKCDLINPDGKLFVFTPQGLPQKNRVGLRAQRPG